MNVTPIRPRRFTRGSLALAQTILPLKLYSCSPIVIAPTTCVPGDGTRISSAEKPPPETSMVKAVELAPASPAFRSILYRRPTRGLDLGSLGIGDFHTGAIAAPWRWSAAPLRDAGMRPSTEQKPSAATVA